jgi:4-amino-4-deoxy-L-arabinose transferase-like glycosyltransferase
MKFSWRTVAAIIILCLVTWLPRASAFDQVVTPDERKWLARSANFNYAIAHGDLEQTFQREHPGVTIMWAGALGILQQFPTYAQEAPGPFGWAVEELEPWLRANTSVTPLGLLIAGRRWIVFFETLAMIGAFFALRRLFGEGLAFLVTLYVFVDPFFIANSFELHPDGLLTALFFLAAMSFLAWLYGGLQRRYLVLSAFATGLAWLTKTPGVFLAPTVGAIALMEILSGRQPLRRMVVSVISWRLLALLTFVALWPAMWVNPLGTLARMYAELMLYAQGHINPNFFRGEVTQAPGVLFYPIAYLLRTTPATLIGLILAAPLMMRKKWPFSEEPVRRTIYTLLIFVVLFTLGISAGAKRFDRYRLPAFVILDVIAILGWVGLADMVATFFIKNRHRLNIPGRRSPTFAKNRTSLVAETDLLARTHQYALASALIALLAGHALFSLLNAPYFLTYYNPLLGGSRTAERMLMVGWGEGLDQAADWLNKQPDSGSARIVAWYGDGPLSYFLDSDLPTMDFWQPDFWADADYAVIYVNQRQREIPSYEALHAIESEELLYVVNEQGIDLARIYRMPDQPPEFTDMHTESATTFGDVIRLAAYALGKRTVLTGESLIIRYHLEKIGEVDGDLVQTTRLVDADGEEVWRGEATIDDDEAWPLHHYRHVFQEIQVPAGIPAGAYDVTVTYQLASDPAQPLPPASNQTGHDAHVVTTLMVLDSIREEINVDWGAVRLREVSHSVTATPGEPLLVAITADGKVDGSLKLSLRAVDEAGAVVAQLDKPVAANMEFALAIPDDLAPGELTLHAVLYDPETLAPLPDQNGEFSAGLSIIRVR